MGYTMTFKYEWEPCELKHLSNTRNINQNEILNSELLNIIDYNYIFEEDPINRVETKPTLENLKSRLETLRNKINAVENCELKKNA